MSFQSGGLPSSAGGWARSTFASLAIRNYRLFFAGQAVSICGAWMQGVAQSWLVLQLSDSGYALGLATALQCLPIFALAPYGGVLADRFSKRKLLLLTQSCAAMLALILGALVASGRIELWMVYLLAFLLGCVNAVDNPVRQSFVHELVGTEMLRNAVTLNSLEVNISRVIGPAVAGILIVTVGLAPCFILNGASFSAVLLSLWSMNVSELHRSAPIEVRRGQVREGLAYARRTPGIFIVLAMMAIVGTFTYEFQVSLPLLAQYVFQGDASVYALLTSSMGVGSVVGGLMMAGRRGRATLKRLVVSTFGFAGTMLAVSLAPSAMTAALGMAAVGIFSLAFTSLCNAKLQIESVSHMRGRIMSLWTVAFLGSTLVGAPIIGLVGEVFGARWTLAVGAAAAAAALLGMHARHRLSSRPVAAELRDDPILSEEDSP